LQSPSVVLFDFPPINSVYSKLLWNLKSLSVFERI